MKKKLGNDVEFQITVTRLGVAEDFTNATDILVKVYQHNGNCGYVVASYERTNNVFDVYLLADNLSLGTYDCDISYKLPDVNSPTGTRSCSGSYRSVFTVVKNTEDEDDEGQGIVINVGYVKDGASAYVYIASASDTLGSNFSYPADLTQDYIAILSTTIGITPEASDFAGLWFSKIDAYRAAVIGGYTGTEEEFFAEEQNRVEAELLRVSAEQTRALNEISRNNAEILRESNEDTRQENELSRISAENTREDSEGDRISAEVIRSSNEVNRINAELLRNSNESTRGINEGIRQDNEVTRIANENIRIANEGDGTSGRVKAELDRVAAEAVREVIKDSMIELNENPPKLIEANDRLVWHYWDLSTHAYVSSSLSGALNWRGVYVAGSTYIPLDVVSYNESTWLCIAESTGNLPTTAYFVPLAKGSYQYWLEAGNTGTEVDYLDWLRKPATDAATAANTAANLANQKAVLADEKALLADQKATEANTAAGSANNAATAANNAASAVTSAINAQIVEVGFDILDSNTILSTGDGQASFLITSVLNGFSLVGVIARVMTASSSGLPTFQIRKNATDLLSTLLTIDATETTSLTATTPAIIIEAQKTVATGDIIYIDCDVAGTGTKGENIILQFQQ